MTTRVESILRRDCGSIDKAGDPLHSAFQFGHIVIDLPNNHGKTPLHYATFGLCKLKSKTAVELLLRAGTCSIDAKKFGGKTPLYDAVDFSLIEVVRILKGEGCNTNAKLPSGSRSKWYWESISDERRLEIRAGIYFDRSLLSILLFWILKTRHTMKEQNPRK